MSANPIRVATAALSGRIFAGRPTKDGRGFKEPRYDVTSDVLVAVRDKIGVGYEMGVSKEGGEVEFRIQVLPPRDENTRTTDARITSLEEENARLREAVQPFVNEFERRRASYIKRYKASPDLGARNFDNMPDGWPMEKVTFTIGDYRRARAALNGGAA